MKAEGHDVIGITLQLYDHGEATGRKGSCCAGQDIHDARRVAEAIGIPHYVLDYEERFAAKVIDSFAESYVHGETPIPCVTCNNEIKFRDLLDTARELGADILATGHYVQRLETPAGPVLARAGDADRDQSYFLFGINKEQLATLRFPIGGLKKPEVRELARRYALPIAEKPDSQDICFVPAGRYSDVIAKLKPGAAEPGDIVHIDGRVLGRHEGIIHYTVGQRRGLKIAAAEPLFVVRLDAGASAVIVGPRAALETKSLVLRNTNWLGDNPLDRSHAMDCPSMFVCGPLRRRGRQRCSADADGTVRVVLCDGEEGVATGQACVFYERRRAGGAVLGGRMHRQDLEIARSSGK